MGKPTGTGVDFLKVESWLFYTHKQDSDTTYTSKNLSELQNMVKSPRKYSEITGHMPN